MQARNIKARAVVNTPMCLSSHTALKIVKKMHPGLQFEGCEGKHDNFKLQDVIAMLCNCKISMLFDDFYLKDCTEEIWRLVE